MKAEALINTFGYALEQPKAKTPGDTLSDVEVRALLNTLAKLLAEVNIKTLCNTLRDVQGKALVYTSSDILVKARPMDTATNWAVYRPKH